MMRLPLLVLAMLVLAGCSTPNEPEGLEWRAPEPAQAGCTDAAGVELDGPHPVVVLETSFGEMRAELYAQEAPVTVENFLDLARSGFYDGTSFHRIIEDFMMQGGDPNSKDDDPSNDGHGGPGYAIPDEFHHRLRHDAAGTLSMANSGPHTGGSQFYVTFGPTPWLDDRHSVFGRVIEGLDVLERIDEEAADEVDERGQPLNGGRPKEEVVLHEVRVEEASGAPDGEASVGLLAPDAHQKVPASGGSAGYLVVAVSCSAHLLQATVEGEGRVEEGFDAFDLPAAQRVAFVVHVDVPEGAPGDVQVPVTLRAGGAEATVTLTAQRDRAVGTQVVERGDPVRAHYVGLLEDGRMFDTSYQEVDRFNELPRFGSYGERDRGEPLSFTTGQRVVEGFSVLADGTPEGGTDAQRIPPEQAYGKSGDHQLAGRSLLFQLEVVEIEEE